MLIPGLTLTPGLAERLRACGDGGRRLSVGGGGLYDIEVVVDLGEFAATDPAYPMGVIRWEELSEHEQRRVQGVIAAHRAEPF